MNDITEFMANKIGKHVDKFHFPNHVDKWCHDNCNPADVKHLNGVNTPVCEQLFSGINKFTNAKAMNECHFFLFFLYTFDLHNLNIEGKLRSVANPKSEYRYEMLKNASNKTEIEDVEDVAGLMKSLAVNDNDLVEVNTQTEAIGVQVYDTKVPQYSCKLCEVKYKREGYLKLHMKNKHPTATWEKETHEVNKCKVCGSSFVDKSEFQKHMSMHFKCNICDVPFDDLKYLNRHIKNNHGTIRCKVCDIECSDKDAFSLHMTDHLKCNVCGKQFDKLHKLNRHMKTHE